MSNNKLNPAEAVMGYVVWLTSQDIPVILSDKHTVTLPCDAVKIFLEANGFAMQDVRANFDKILVHPKKELPATNLQVSDGRYTFFQLYEALRHTQALLVKADLDLANKDRWLIMAKAEIAKILGPNQTGLQDFHGVTTNPQ